jgi:hypothetical protein
VIPWHTLGQRSASAPAYSVACVYVLCVGTTPRPCCWVAWGLPRCSMSMAAKVDHDVVDTAGATCGCCHAVAQCSSPADVSAAPLRRHVCVVLCCPGEPRPLPAVTQCGYGLPCCSRPVPPTTYTPAHKAAHAAGRPYTGGGTHPTHPHTRSTACGTTRRPRHTYRQSTLLVCARTHPVDGAQCSKCQLTQPPRHTHVHTGRLSAQGAGGSNTTGA